MEVILLESVKKLGNTGDVVSVKNGYARNFLVPTKKAMFATKDNIAVFEQRKGEIEKENKAKTSEAEKLADKIKNTVVSLIQQAGEDGRLYGSISSVNISDALAKKTKEDIDRKQITLHNPIKYIGIHDIEIHLFGNVSAIIHANVARSEGEAKDAEKKFSRGERVAEGPSAESAQEAEEEEAVIEVKADDSKEEKAEAPEKSEAEI